MINSCIADVPHGLCEDRCIWFPGRCRFASGLHSLGARMVCHALKHHTHTMMKVSAETRVLACFRDGSFPVALNECIGGRATTGTDDPQKEVATRARSLSLPIFGKTIAHVTRTSAFHLVGQASVAESCMQWLLTRLPHWQTMAGRRAHANAQDGAGGTLFFIILMPGSTSTIAGSGSWASRVTKY